MLSSSRGFLMEWRCRECGRGLSARQRRLEAVFCGDRCKSTAAARAAGRDLAVVVWLGGGRFQVNVVLNSGASFDPQAIMEEVVSCLPPAEVAVFLSPVGEVALCALLDRLPRFLTLAKMLVPSQPASSLGREPQEVELERPHLQE